LVTVDCSDSDQLHLAIRDNFVGDVLPKLNPNIDVLSELSSNDDVIYSLYARGIVLVHRSRIDLDKAHVLEKVAQYLRHNSSVTCVEAA
jgi:hypothetical protein